MAVSLWPLLDFSFNDGNVDVDDRICIAHTSLIVGLKVSAPRGELIA